MYILKQGHSRFMLSGCPMLILFVKFLIIMAKVIYKYIIQIIFARNSTNIEYAQAKCKHMVLEFNEIDTFNTYTEDILNQGIRGHEKWFLIKILIDKIKTNIWIKNNCSHDEILCLFVHWFLLDTKITMFSMGHNKNSTLEWSFLGLLCA